MPLGSTDYCMTIYLTLGRRVLFSIIGYMKKPLADNDWQA